MATRFNTPSVAELLLLCKENAKLVSSPNNPISGVMIATLRLKDKNDARKICRYVAVAYPTGVRGVPAWSEQDALESLHKALAEKAAVMLSERNFLGGLNDFEVLAGDEGERLHVHAPI